MIKDFKENEIRNKILAKINPGKINKKTAHWKGYIYSDNVLVAKVKIPNDHSRIMHAKKSKYIARDLKLDDNQFNRLIECPLKGRDYYEIISHLA
jgi:hypothetical protein